MTSYDFGIKNILLPEVVPVKLQGSILKIFKLAREVEPLGPMLAAKAIVTLKDCYRAPIIMRTDWFDSLLSVFQPC